MQLFHHQDLSFIGLCRVRFYGNPHRQGAETRLSVVHLGTHLKEVCAGGHAMEHGSPGSPVIGIGDC
jgi:hypothetical protein